MLAARIRTSLTNHRALSRAIQNGQGPVREVLQSWERLYRAFILRRFDRYSRGGGDWKKNAPGIIKKKKSSAILVDTRAMRLGLGSGIRAIRSSARSIVFAFTNRSRHPTATGLTIADLATKHDKGLGVPQRKILVIPDQQTRKQLLSMAARRLSDAANGRN